MEWVTREFHKGEWVNNYFHDAKTAKTLMMKILKKGGVAICLRSAK